MTAQELFQSTRPVRGATCICECLLLHRKVSIHAPRAGRDAVHATASFRALSFNPRAPCGARRGAPSRGRSTRCFNPRAPCGARPRANVYSSARATFQSTRPVRGATDNRDPLLNVVTVSIHAPRAGRDHVRCRAFGESAVSIHAPRAGRDFFA